MSHHPSLCAQEMLTYGVRGINAGPVSDMEDLCAALEATQMQLEDIIDKVYPFDKAEEAVQSLWDGKVIGKVVIRL